MNKFVLFFEILGFYILRDFQWIVNISLFKLSQLGTVNKCLSRFLSHWVFRWRWFASTNLRLRHFWITFFIIQNSALFVFLNLCHLTFDQIVCESWIMMTFILKYFIFSSLSCWILAFEDIIVNLTRKVDIIWFLLISLTGKIFHQPIDIGIDFIGLAIYAWRIENGHFILLILVFVLDTWHLSTLNTLIS